MGPVLIVPYTMEWQVKIQDSDSKVKYRTERKTKYRYIIPETLNIMTEVNTDIRYKGIYEVPVYTSRWHIDGRFNPDLLVKERVALEKKANVTHVGQPFLSLGIADPRGINSTPSLKWSDQTIAFAPGSRQWEKSQGIHALLPDLTSVADPVFSFQLDIRGMEALNVVPVARDVSVQVKADWPHPEFVGAFLPNNRQITAEQFDAHWQVTSFATNIDEKIKRCEVGACDELNSIAFGVRLVEPVDVYLQSERSVKYGMLFIGVCFIAFLILELTKDLKIHSVQYLLVGLAMAIFYLLLISLSEHIAFSYAYGIATIACASLLLFYVSHVLKNSREAGLFALSLLLLYGTLFVIIQAEDFALLMGAGLTFFLLSTVMFVTRKIDWYKLNDKL